MRIIKLRSLFMSRAINLRVLMSMMALFLSADLVAAPPREDVQSVIPLLSDEECWRKLSTTEKEGVQPLPSWARATAGAMPRTTAAMLQLDFLHRTRNPLGPLLRGKMRWVAAQANRCEYSEAYAESDLRLAGLDETGRRSLRGDHVDLPEAERAALEFARQMTLDASEVTDAEVARLLGWYGEEKITAMVLLLAHANFQDRLLLALGSPIESGGPLPPLEMTFDPKADPPLVPPRKRPEGRLVPEEPARIDDPFWLSMEFDDLQGKLTEQRERPSRIRVPTFAEVLRRMPPQIPRPERPIRIRWTLVTMGYQAELASAWSATTKAFREESKQDRVFEESLFWIVTRTIHCFY
jgi:alkylhydroperoxidase family enzyme